MDFRKQVLQCLGVFPKMAALNPEIIQTEDKGTHLLQKVQYDVEESDRISAWLLTPKGLKGKIPALIAAHQHGGEYWLGKSEPAGLSRNRMYHYGLDLCLRGYVVLCPDHLAFEDRRPPEYERKEHPYVEGPGYERLLFCEYLAKGSTLQAKYLSDLTRGIDFLETLENVDREKIGAIGHSLGGQETMWLAWYDKRIKAAVCSCGISQQKSIFRERINHNFAMFTFGLLQVGDIADLVCAIAPRPFMMTNGTKDRIFPMDGVEEIHRLAQQKYDEINAPGHFYPVVFEGEHAFPEPMKAKAYDWLDKYLK